MAKTAINNNKSNSHNDCQDTNSLKYLSGCPHEPDSVRTSLCTATQRSLEESILEIPKIPKKKGKAAGGGGSANLNLGNDDSDNSGVSRSSDRSAKGPTTSRRIRGE